MMRDSSLINRVALPRNREIVSERKLWQICFWTGLATLILGAIVLSIFPKGDFVYPKGYGEPVIAFEFAKTIAQVKAAIGYGQTGWEDRLSAMKRGTRADFVFIFAFGLFTISFFLAVFKQNGQRIFKVFAIIAVMAALSDFTEDIMALHILHNIGLSHGVAWMHYFVKIKFFGLGMVGLGAAYFLIRQPRHLRKLEGLFALLGGVITLFALSRPSQMGAWLGLGITLSWMAMLAYAATQSFKKITLS